MTHGSVGAQNRFVNRALGNQLDRSGAEALPSHELRSFGRKLLAGVVSAYLRPTIVAADREHPQLEAIACANLLTGWTAIGWLVALVWARSTTIRAT